ncbi:MAG: endonuclease MutS2 [Peptococcaceae bacterium]
MEQSLIRLEYNKVLEKISSFAASPPGKERVLSLRPYTDLATILIEQARTTEGKELRRKEPGADFQSWFDFRAEIVKATRGTVLTPAELLLVGKTLAVVRQTKTFFINRRGQYPLLEQLGSSLGDFTALEKKIMAVLSPSGEIMDQASPELANIRRKLTNVKQQIKERLEKMLRAPAYLKYFQDLIVTVRNERYVVPVKQECRHQVPGIIHDQSASGATIYIEPMEIVEPGNEMRRLQASEAKEINRLLYILTQAVAERHTELNQAITILSQLDFIMAKAIYSQTIYAFAPEIIPEYYLDIKQGRHPLLNSKEAVPISVKLGQEYDTLIITGPNAGGKTVALKTIGLTVLMAQAGLHVPAEEGTKIGLFETVLADIGDEQSIEQSLSTFSAHLFNLKEILNRANFDSLVLLDELGMGTDPVEGAALAQAVLEELQAKGAKTIATTHYSELKNFALTHKKAANACVEFDPVTYKPTYRLLIGRPGLSLAFEVALKCGLAEETVSRAKEFLTSGQIEALDLIKEINKQQQKTEKVLHQTQKKYQQAKALKKLYRDRLAKITAQRDTILKNAWEKAEAITREAKRQAEEAVKELRAKLIAENNKERELAIQEIRKRLQIKTVSPRCTEALNLKSLPMVAVGQEVYLPRLRQSGFVQNLAEDGMVQVQVGILKINVPPQELCYKEAKRRGVKLNASAGGTQMAALLAEKARHIETRLDLRGLSREEALYQLNQYLDNAVLAGLPRAELIHGKGTGILRQAIHEQLKNDFRIKAFRLGELAEGGTGVTIVEFK